MTRVSSSDQILLLLRERLQRLNQGRGTPTNRSNRNDPAPRTPLARLKALSALDGLSTEELGRAMIRSLLSEELGEAASSDPSFAAVAEEVSRMIESNEEGRTLIERAALELRTRR